MFIRVQQVRSILDRFHTNADNRLSLEGFLQYQTDAAWYNPKNVWKDLSAFGYGNNLLRAAPGSTGLSGVPSGASDDNLGSLSGAAAYASGSGSSLGLVPAMQLDYSVIKSVVPPSCKACLLSLGLYEAGMDTSEPSAKAIAKRVCMNDPEYSTELLKQVRYPLHDLRILGPSDPSLPLL